MGGKIVALCVLTKDEELAKDIAMQIAAMRPLYLNRESVPAEVVEKEKEILKEQAENEGLDASKLEMIVNGRINKFYEEVFDKIELPVWLKLFKGAIKSILADELDKIVERRAGDSTSIGFGANPSKTQAEKELEAAKLLNKAIGLIIGIMIFHKICQLFAESIFAASKRLGLIFCKPLINRTIGIPVNQRIIDSSSSTPVKRFANGLE